MGGKLTRTQLKNLDEITQSKLFAQLIDHIEMNEDRWISFMEHPTAET